MHFEKSATESRRQRATWVIALSLARRYQVAGVGILLAIVLTLHAYAALMQPVNSDEPQHLHVVWAWTQGLVPYRDVFDNHAPLFQWLCMPLLNWFGERPDIVRCMRLAMTPLYALALWLTWYIGRVLWSLRVGLIAAGLVALAPVFFPTSVEFRPDNLWMVLWLACLAAAVSPLAFRRRAVLAGFLLGAAFAVSLKSVLLVVTCGASLAIVYALAPWKSTRARRMLAVDFFLASTAALVVPAAFTIYLASVGAWHQAMYGLFSHNMVGGLGFWRDSGVRFLLVAVGWPASAFVLRRFMPSGSAVEAWRLRAWLLLSAVLYLLALYGAWPLVSHQDLLPILPLVGIGTAALVAGEPGNGAMRKLRIVLIVVLVLVDSTTLISALTTTRDDGIRSDEASLAKVLRLTRPGDYVMDAKGFAIFRKRPVYWVLEGITEHRMELGQMTDDTQERLAETATPVVIADHLPPRDGAFINRNFLYVGDRVRVAGQRLPPAPDGTARTFEVAIPLVYVLLDAQGQATGRVDGQPFDGATFIAAGTHVLTSPAAGPLVLLWAPAFRRGIPRPCLFAMASCAATE